MEIVERNLTLPDGDARGSPPTSIPTQAKRASPVSHSCDLGLEETPFSPTSLQRWWRSAGVRVGERWNPLGPFFMKLHAPQALRGQTTKNDGLPHGRLRNHGTV